MRDQSQLMSSADADAIKALLNDYASCLDRDELERWPGFFMPDGVYKVLSRENVERKLPAPLMYYYSQGMMQDRVTALRNALTYEFVYTRHLISNEWITSDSGGGWRVSSTFAIYQSTEEGVTKLYCVGGYDDRIVLAAEGPRFAERVVTVDTFAILNLIAAPL